MSIAAVLQNEQPWHVENDDVFAGLAALPDRSIHAIVSSPPYLGLRDYGISGRLWPDGLTCCYGLEPDVASYVRHTIWLFEEFRRVLRDDGQIYWNVGDSYNAQPGQRKTTDEVGPKQRTNAGSNTTGSRNDACFPAGSKMLIPHRVAIGLAEAGWIIRQDNVWAKKSPMPESINGSRWIRCRVKTGERENAPQGGLSSWDMGEHTHGSAGAYRGQPKTLPKYQPCPGCPKCAATDGWILRRGSHRTTGAHEYIFQIVKSGEYFGDGDAAQEAVSGGTHSRGTKMRPPKEAEQAAAGHGHNGSCAGTPLPVESRNPRSVWSLSSEAYKGAHFAVFPSELVRRCLVGSLSKGGCCPACGSQYAPQVTKERVATRPGENTKVAGRNSRLYQERDPWHPGEYNGDRYDLEVGNRDPQRHVARTNVLGYLPTCRCQAGPAVPPIVLEPFCGSGTTLQVATHMGFRAIGFERNPNYIELAKTRIGTMPRCLLPKVAKKVKARPIVPGQRSLFAEETA